MIDKNSQIKAKIYSTFSAETQTVFNNRKSQLMDDSKAFSLILEMLQYELVMGRQVQQKKVVVTNQAKEEKLKFANGVIMRPGPDGKMIFEEA